MNALAAHGAHIEFSQVGVVYADSGEGVDACADLTFTVKPGESVALIGPSGCGKSTTLHIAAGLIQPTSGIARVNGEPLARPRTETAFIPQDLGLLPWKTVLHNAMLPLTLRHVPKQEAADRARAALQQVGLAGRDRAWPRELSGGQRQRLALARALVTDADLLLMDEPLSAVDALLREQLQDALLDLWRRRAHTQLFVTHSIEEAVYLGQRILVFSDRPGTIVADIANPALGQRTGNAVAAEVRSLLREGADAEVKVQGSAEAQGEAEAQGDAEVQGEAEALTLAPTPDSASARANAPAPASPGSFEAGGRS